MVFACVLQGEKAGKDGDFKVWCVGVLLMGLLGGSQGQTSVCMFMVFACVKGKVRQLCACSWYLPESRGRSDICVYVHGICLYV